MLAVERIVLIAWIGGLWTVGFMVAPTLFAMLDSRALAGNVAGRLFSTMSFVGLVCGALLLGLAWKTYRRQILRQWRAWTVATMLVLTAVGQFVITPLMQQARAAGLGDPTVSDRFQLLHGVSTTLFAVTSLLGLVIAWFGVIRSGR